MVHKNKSNIVERVGESEWYLLAYFNFPNKQIHQT